MPKNSWPPETASTRKRRLSRGELRKEEWAATPAWRTGRKLGRTIYRGDALIGIMDTAADAALAVKAVNKFFAPPDEA